MPEVHNIFVTGLTFLPTSQSLEKANQEFGLLTISADNTCRLVTLPNRSKSLEGDVCPFETEAI